MSALNLNIGLANLGCGLVVLILAAPIMLRRIQQTGPATQQVWQTMRQFCGEKFALWSVALLTLGTVAMFLPMADQPTLAMALAIAPVALVVPCVEAFRLSRRFDRLTMGQ